MAEIEKLIVTSTAFAEKGNIPVKYTCKGEDISPPFEVKGIPAGAKSLVLFVDDPDAAMGTWDHWVVWNISTNGKISENTVPGVQGLNSWGKNSWGGPCPPSGMHRYYFKVYALDSLLSLKDFARKKDVERAMEGRILAKGELMAYFSK